MKLGCVRTRLQDLKHRALQADRQQLLSILYPRTLLSLNPLLHKDTPENNNFVIVVNGGGGMVW